MSTFKSHQEIVKELKHFSDKLANGELSLKELEAYQYLIRTLYERVIVLEYKAKEKYAKEKSTASASLIDSQIKEEKALNTKGVKTTKEPIEPSILFDFSTPTNTVSDASSENQQSLATEKTEKEPTQNPTAEQGDLEPEIEDIAPVEVETTIESTAPTQKDDFFDQFLVYNDDSLLGKLAASKVDSLKGAFGLNDRLQIIHELFNGNSEAFQISIETLDDLPSFEQAKVKLNEIAAQHQWEPDHLLVGDFVKMIQRRYA
jgi:hypothetical protein